MKYIALILFLILSNINIYSQIDANDYVWDDGVSPEMFEKQAPIYILQNYYSPTGLTDIIKAARLDDRVGGINLKNQNRPENPEIVIKYYNNVIVFDKGKSTERLGIFRIYFTNQKDLDIFTTNYTWLMGFIRDDKNPNRYYLEERPMNALIKNSYPEQKNFYALCFVF